MMMRFKILADLEWIISWIEFKTYTYTLTDESTCVCVYVCVCVWARRACVRACVKKRQEIAEGLQAAIFTVCMWVDLVYIARKLSMTA